MSTTCLPAQRLMMTQTFGPNTAFVNITVTNLDELSHTATLTASGHRVCGAICPPTTSTFFSLGNEAAERRGLPPSAAVTVPGESGTYTFTIELPIRGTPQLYPFDTYTLLLGLVISVTLPNGREEVITNPELVRERISLTLEDQVVRLNMSPPLPVDPASVHSETDPVDFLLVDQLQWQRPLYLRIVTVLLGEAHFRLRHLCPGSAHAARAGPWYRRHHPRDLGRALGRGANRAPRRNADRSHPGLRHTGALARACNSRRPLLLCPERAA